MHRHRPLEALAIKDVDWKRVLSSRENTGKRVIPIREEHRERLRAF